MRRQQHGTSAYFRKTGGIAGQTGRAPCRKLPIHCSGSLASSGRPRKVVLAHTARTRNLTPQRRFLRSANGLLDLLSRIEKARAEELKALQATAALQDERALEEEFNQHLDRLEEHMKQAQAVHGAQIGEEEPKLAGPGIH